MEKIHKANATPLEQAVLQWFNEKGEDYEDGWRGACRDLEMGGCQSGIVSDLVYYADTVAFYEKHRKEINRLLGEAIEDNGWPVHMLFGNKWNNLDPLAQEEENQNLLAWFGFEETAHNLASENGYDDYGGAMFTIMTERKGMTRYLLPLGESYSYKITRDNLAAFLRAYRKVGTVKRVYRSSGEKICFRSGSVKFDVIPYVKPNELIKRFFPE